MRLCLGVQILGKSLFKPEVVIWSLSGRGLRISHGAATSLNFGEDEALIRREQKATAVK